MSIGNLDIVSRVPREIATGIFLYVDPVELERFRRVCKQWQSLISENNPLWASFAKTFKIISLPQEDFRSSVLQFLKRQHKPSVKDEKVLDEQVNSFLKVKEQGKIIALEYLSAKDPNAYLCAIRYITTHVKNAEAAFDPLTSYVSVVNPHLYTLYKKGTQYEDKLSAFQGVLKIADIKVEIKGSGSADYAYEAEPRCYFYKIALQHGLFGSSLWEVHPERLFLISNNIDYKLIEKIVGDTSRYSEAITHPLSKKQTE